MNISSVSTSVAQEAVETAAQTRAEAAKGDQQAARKMAAAQTQVSSAEASQPPEGTGQVLNVKA